MDQYLEFVINHWVLVGLLIGLVITLIYTENLKRGAGISLHEATRVINQENGVVVDLRPENEFKEGHITSALNVPYPDLSSRLNELDKHREKPVILVCKAGQHSGAASKVLRDSGFGNVKRLNGGMTEWGNANMPVVKGAKG
ncbi:MAG: rhodanese-like domain-containing protein [Pseudomonadales bacterium]